MNLKHLSLVMLTEAHLENWSSTSRIRRLVPSFFLLNYVGFYKKKSISKCYHPKYSLRSLIKNAKGLR